MIRYFRRPFLCILICSISIICLSQKTESNRYNIQLLGGEIGEIVVNKTVDGNISNYNIISEVNFKVPFKKYNRKTVHQIQCRNDEVIKSRTAIYMNDELEDSTALDFLSGKLYKCYNLKDGVFNKSFDKPLITSATVYFKQPSGNQLIFSERFLEYCQLDMISENEYILYLTNGKENVYTYENKQLSIVKVDRTWFKIEFIKVPN